MTSTPDKSIKTCRDCLNHQNVGLRGCGCVSRLLRSHSQLYCPRLGQRAQDATKCPGFHQVPDLEPPYE